MSTKGKELENLSPGEYKFKIVAVCENSTKRFERTITINYDGKVTTDNKSFFKEHFKVK